MTTPIYDVIIIGGGMAGLYAAYSLQKKYTSTNIINHTRCSICSMENTAKCANSNVHRCKKISILLLEKESQLGGRAGTEMFHGVPISIGAGIGRKHKDHLLIKLLHELNVQNHEFETSTEYSPALQKSKTLMKKQFSHLRSVFKDPIIQKQFKNRSFSEFAKHILGQEEYSLFSQCAGYTDYENADIHDVLYDYGFDDNTSSWTGVSLHWSDMIKSLVKSIGKSNIKTDHLVSKIKIMKENGQNPDPVHKFEILANQQVYKCNTVIMATTVDAVKRLLPTPINTDIYDQIHGQPFLRMYGKFTKSSSQILSQYLKTQTVVQGPIHKIIPINQEKGIHMFVYTDNDGAKMLKRYTKNTEKNRQILSKYLERALGIPENTLIMTDMRDFYWNIGTHYYEPMHNPGHDDVRSSNRSAFIDKAQHPFPNIFIVGEMVSKNQGWVEGALESVEKII